MKVTGEAASTSIAVPPCAPGRRGGEEGLTKWLQEFADKNGSSPGQHLALAV
jgi:hypothetical protein